MKSTEKATQAAILEWLAWKRIFHWRNNTGAMKTERGSFIRFGAKGSPDIFVLTQGVLFGIECKDVKAKPTPDQVAFGEALERAGGVYIVARRLEDVEQIAELPKAA